MVGMVGDFIISLLKFLNIFIFYLFFYLFKKERSKKESKRGVQKGGSTFCLQPSKTVILFSQGILLCNI